MSKKLKLRWAGECAECSTALAGGTEAWWDSAAKAATCIPCHDGPPPIETGVAGASAAAEYEKRSRRETRRKEAVVAKDAAWRGQVKESQPILGRVAAALTPKPAIGPESQSTRAWKVGEVGELAVAKRLAECEGVIALHDRRVPGTKGNIDHLAVGPGGVYIVDAKRYEGKVERRDVGSFFRPDVRLYVNNRDRTKVVKGMAWQVEAVRKTMHAGGHADVPLRAVLCFVEAEWTLFAKPIVLGGVTILWPKAMQERRRRVTMPESAADGGDREAAVAEHRGHEVTEVVEADVVEPERRSQTVEAVGADIRTPRPALDIAEHVSVISQR